jgi:LysR family transcriptional regulator for bpeEF and oprC
MHTTLREMNIFVRAVDLHSFVGAAKSLLVDPAAVSRAIKAIEADLGILLLARSTRALKLTPEGARFYRDCVELLKKYEQTTQQFRAVGSKPHGRLTVGMGPSLTRRMLLRAIPSFQQQYPAIEIVLVSVDDMDEIGGGGPDILIRPRGQRRHGGMHRFPQGLIVRKLAQPPLVPCASPEYLKRAGTPRVPADLVRHACVVLLSMEHDILDEWHFVKSQMRQRIKVAPKLLVHGMEALREAALAGCGIIRPLACHIEDELRRRKLVPVLPDWECTGASPMVAIYRKTQPAIPQVSLFVNHLIKAFQRYNAAPVWR